MYLVVVLFLNHIPIFFLSAFEFILYNFKNSIIIFSICFTKFLIFFLYKIKYKYESVLWIFDRLVIAVALGGMLVRIGNFFNSEIVGNYTGSNFGVIFLNRSENLPRHPAQLSESLGYLILFIILFALYQKTKLVQKKGFFFGFFLIFLFGVRFIVEYVKESQGGLENYLGILSTGQWLSIPFMIIGLALLIRSNFNKI